MFKLNIECTKDISELHINFTDGTSAVVENSKPKSEKSEPIQRKQKVDKSPLKAEEFIDSESDWGDYSEPISSEKIELPKISIPDRAVKVDSNLQNLEI